MEANVVRLPELRFAPSGTAWVSMRVVAKDRKKQGDQWVDGESLFIDVKAFERIAEHIAETFTEAGESVLINGVLKQREYETDGGEKRTVYEVVIDNFGSIGPSLRWKPWAANSVERAARTTDDPWSTPSQAGPTEPPW